jgi:outer membrane protein
MPISRCLASACALAALALTAAPASAGSESGNFLVRVQGTWVGTQDELNGLTSTALGDLKAAGWDTEVSNEYIPTLTLTYFLNKNLAVELFCCFTKHQIEVAAVTVPALSGEIADSWIFPPALTLQYHFDGMGTLKPYLGAGVQYMNFFDEKTGDNSLRSSSVEIDDAWGFTLQAGVDVSVGGGWYLNADIKKTWMDTDATWLNVNSTAGHTVFADVDLDPLIVSVGVGYRFNLDDIFGRREQASPLK